MLSWAVGTALPLLGVGVAQTSIGCMVGAGDLVGVGSGVGVGLAVGEGVGLGLAVGEMTAACAPQPASRTAAQKIRPRRRARGLRWWFRALSIIAESYAIEAADGLTRTYRDVAPDLGLGASGLRVSGTERAGRERRGGYQTNPEPTVSWMAWTMRS
jgi:hypothetical protein